MYAIISPHPSLVPAFKACSEAESAKQYSKTSKIKRQLATVSGKSWFECQASLSLSLFSLFLYDLYDYPSNICKAVTDILSAAGRRWREKVPMWCSTQHGHGHPPTHPPHIRLENNSNRNSLENTCFLLFNVLILFSDYVKHLCISVSSYISSSVSVWSLFAKLWAWFSSCVISAWAGSND